MQYRFKIKNLQEEKYELIELQYYAYLRFRKSDQSGNYAILPFPLSSKGRPALKSNVIIGIQNFRMPDRFHVELKPCAKDGSLNIEEIFDTYPGARLNIKCIFTDAGSGMRKVISREYGSADIKEGWFRPVNPFGRCRTWFKIRFRERVHPELEIIDPVEAQQYLDQRNEKALD